MIDYRKLGHIAPKQHTVFELEGKMLSEHVFTRDGFNDLYSILYQRRAPTHEVGVEPFRSHHPHFLVVPAPAAAFLKRRHLKTPLSPKGGDFFASRVTLFHNRDVTVGICRPDAPSAHFFSNGDADELYFVAEGSGRVETMFGTLDFGPNDYVYIPKCTPYRFLPNGPTHMMVVEGSKGFGIPKEFRNVQGQLKLDAPYNHRDFRGPERLDPPQGNPGIVVKRLGTLTLHTYTEWPYQVLGWDGWVYPFVFPVSAYQPKTSSVHLPPSVHTAFAGQGFYIMNFVPRLLDYHPKAIPCPYPHSNVDCDEILFYVHGNFTSRKAIEQYSMSFHPGGIPHGPHPEKYEQSVGHLKTDELAIMVDTFAPLELTAAALLQEDSLYHDSWNTSDHL